MRFKVTGSVVGLKCSEKKSYMSLSFQKKLHAIHVFFTCERLCMWQQKYDIALNASSVKLRCENEEIMWGHFFHVNIKESYGKKCNTHDSWKKSYWEINESYDKKIKCENKLIIWGENCMWTVKKESCVKINKSWPKIFLKITFEKKWITYKNF